MNVPFPGMDPYLEHPALWPGFHNGLMFAIAAQLQPLLEPRYVATVESRVYLEGPDTTLIPDVAVRPSEPATPAIPSLGSAASQAVLVEVAELEINEAYVEIRDLYDNEKLVALIEVLSPANKHRGPGHASYRAKRREVLARDCHFIEIDLLRKGHHVMVVPESRLARLRPYTYLASVSRWPRRRWFELYHWELREPIPTIALPLRPPDADVPLELRQALAKVYWEGRYARRVKYDAPCVPKLARADQNWATRCWQEFKAAQPSLFPAAPP